MYRFQLIKEELRNFGSVVSIQGVRYLGDTQQGPLFQLIWFAIVTASFIISAICIKNSITGMEYHCQIDVLSEAFSNSFTLVCFVPFRSVLPDG